MANYIKIWLDGSYIKIPSHLLHSDREREVMQLDLRFRGTGVKINKAIHRAMQENDGKVTVSMIESIKKRVRNRARMWLLTQRLDASDRGIEARLADMVRGNDGGTVRLREAILASIGTTPLRLVKNLRDDNFTDTVLVISDLHGSFHPALPSMVNELRPRYILIAGDVFDANAANNARNNPKSRQDYKVRHREGTYIEQEIRTVRALFEAFIEGGYVQKIFLMYGNHDANIIDYLHRVIDPKFWSLIRSPFDLLTIGLEDHVKVLDQYMMPRSNDFTAGRSNVEYNSPYFVDIGREINLMSPIYVSHMNFTGSFPGQSVQKLWKWLGEKGWMHATGMVERGADMVLMQAHTHKLAKIVLPGGRGFGFETGTMAHPVMFEYSIQYKNSFSPAQYGFVRFNMDTTYGGGCELRWDSVDVVAPFMTGGYSFSVTDFADGLGNPFSDKFYKFS